MSSSTRKDEVMTSLIDGIKALATSETWRQWLKIQSRFHRYSFNNSLLIQLQCPSATRIAGFHAWRQLGRNVRKGEKAIWILAPVTKLSGELVFDAGTANESRKPTREIVNVKPVAVFDIAQTDGEDLPEVCSRLIGDDATGAFGSLIQVACGIGYAVVDAEFEGSKNGDCTFAEHRIRIATDRSPIQRVKTLAHELAHALLHEGYSDRALAELEAESVAYVVCAELGINTEDYSLGYVTQWSGGGDEAIAAIKTAGARIQRTADRILKDLGGDAASEDKAA
jgi:antirestriction protein ArdC